MPEQTGENWNQCASATAFGGKLQGGDARPPAASPCLPRGQGSPHRRQNITLATQPSRMLSFRPLKSIPHRIYLASNVSYQIIPQITPPLVSPTALASNQHQMTSYGQIKKLRTEFYRHRRPSNDHFVQIANLFQFNSTIQLSIFWTLIDGRAGFKCKMFNENTDRRSLKSPPSAQRNINIVSLLFF